MEGRTQQITHGVPCAPAWGRTPPLPTDAGSPLPAMRSHLLPVHVRRARWRRMVATTLFIADAVAVVLGFVLAYWLRYVLEVGRPVISFQPLRSFTPTILLLLASTLALLWMRGAYRQPRSAR